MHVADRFHLPRFGHELHHVDMHWNAIGTFVAVMMLLGIGFLHANATLISAETMMSEQVDARFLGP